MITAKGTGLLVVAILIFFLAQLTQVGWLYLVDSVLWGMLILSAVLPWVGVALLSAQLRLECAAPKAAGMSPSEGDQVRIEVSLRNRAFWPRFFISLFYDLQDEFKRVTFEQVKLEGMLFAVTFLIKNMKEIIKEGI